jgi:glycosyltransferase involved in cell wall biosynthesis
MTLLVVADATPYGPEPSGARRRFEELLPRLALRLPEAVFEVHWARDGARPPVGRWPPNIVNAVVEATCRGGARRWWRRRRDLERRHVEAPYTHLLVDHGPVVVPPGARTIVTLHDLRFLHGYGGLLRRLYGRWGYGRALRRASAVVAVSPSVAAEATTRYGLDPRRVVAAPNAAAEVFRPGTGERSGLLVVARDEPRKARGAAVVAAQAVGERLTVVEGGLSDGALARAYAGARWLLAPSVEEGFDLPVLEALASATPVVASDIPAHRDLLCGAQGLLLVPPPRRRGSTWTWDEAVDVLRRGEPPPASPPPFSWEGSADLVAAAIRGGPSVPLALGGR